MTGLFAEPAVWSRSACRLRRRRPRSRCSPRCARPRRRLRVRVARYGLHRHRPLHFAILYCPFQCQHLCQSLRQRASHDCLQLPLHFPPLSRRGGSLPRASPASIPFRSYPGFAVPDRVPRLWFSHRTQHAAGVAQARACHAFPCALDDRGCRAHAGTSVFSRAYTPFPHPCRPGAAHVAPRSRDVFSGVAEGVAACYTV